MTYKLLFASLFAVTLLASMVTPVVAAPKTSTRTPLGIDVSWPQCGAKLPTNHAFGIVGVNGGLATTTNECLKEQLVWANKAIGGTKQARVQLYVNTANPGGLGTASWPTTNVDSRNVLAPNPYGVCDGTDSLACAWQYGWNRAVEDVYDRFLPAVSQTTLDKNPASYIWWLDVETENTWKGEYPAIPTTFDFSSNAAVLEGMTAYFADGVGAKVGLYSTGAQWSKIVGNAVASDSNLIGLDNWRPGGASLTTAKQACTAKPLTTGGKVVLTQYIANSLDYNYSCIN
jgi:hypothetical protein